jgi:uncharacterized protein YjbJ (UPF0337 family)
MNKDNFEGGFRSAVGQGEKVLGQAMGDKSTQAQGTYDDAMGKARSALGSAKDAVGQGVDAVSSLDYSALRDEIAKLTRTVADLAQKQVSAGRDQIVSVMGPAGDSLSQSADEVESQIKKNPWAAIGIAALVGLLIGKVT